MPRHRLDGFESDRKALTFSQGKAIINSVNLEEGEKKFEEIAELVHRYGAALVVGTIDEKEWLSLRKEN